ncbi:hypothetical protein BU15DRAFT_61687 [Melanogaster broomeanus]|nr:hypothetical protein BU15DRAFT_61687 [Melanogaster broomeanus]
MSEAVSGSKAFQIASYVGTILQDMIVWQGQRGQRTKSNIFYAFFSSMMFFLIHGLGGCPGYIRRDDVDTEQDYPGGPGQWSASHISIAVWIVWNGYRVIVIPSILWVATLGLGIVVDWTSSSPGGNFFEGLSSILGLSVKNHLGQEYAYAYFDVVSIIVESVLPYTLSGIAFLVSFGTGSPTSVAFLCVYIMAMCISPQMLILRVVLRRARNDDRARTRVTTVKFSPGGTSTTCEESAVAVRFQSREEDIEWTVIRHGLTESVLLRRIGFGKYYCLRIRHFSNTRSPSTLVDASSRLSEVLEEVEQRLKMDYSFAPTPSHLTRFATHVDSGHHSSALNDAANSTNNPSLSLNQEKSLHSLALSQHLSNPSSSSLVCHGIGVKNKPGKECACTYVDVVSIIVECVLPSTQLGTAFLVLWDREPNLDNISLCEHIVDVHITAITYLASRHGKGLERG